MIEKMSEDIRIGSFEWGMAITMRLNKLIEAYNLQKKS